MCSRSRTVCTLRRGPPSAYAALILSVTVPRRVRMLTFRSRGIDMTAVAPRCGSSRTRSIVSERAGFFSLMSWKRRSEPSTRIVCGRPGSTLSSAPSMPGIGALSLLTMRISWSTSSRPAEATVAAEKAKMRNAPSAARFSRPRPGRGGFASSGAPFEAREGTAGRRRSADPGRRPRQREHLRVRERAHERVRDPVHAAPRAPRDDTEPRAVVEQLVRAPADPPALGRVVEDRRRRPGRALEPVVLADRAGVGDDPVGAVDAPGAVGELVRARVVRAIAPARRHQPRVPDRQPREPDLQAGGLVLAGDAVDHEAGRHGRRAGAGARAPWPRARPAAPTPPRRAGPRPGRPPRGARAPGGGTPPP